MRGPQGPRLLELETLPPLSLRFNSLLFKINMHAELVQRVQDRRVSERKISHFLLPRMLGDVPEMEHLFDPFKISIVSTSRLLISPCHCDPRCYFPPLEESLLRAPRQLLLDPSALPFDVQWRSRSLVSLAPDRWYGSN